MSTLKKIKYYHIYILLTISILATLLTGYMIYEIDDRRDSYADRVVHTLTILDSNHQLLTHLLDAETGRRGYLLTGEQEYLEPYLDAITDIDRDYELLLDQTSVYNLTPVHLLEELASSIEYFKEESTRILNLYEEFGLDSAIAGIQTDQAKIVMDRIREINSEIISVQRRILGDRTEGLKTTSTQFQWVSLFGLIFIVSTTVIAAFTIRRKAFENQHMMKKIDDTNAKLYHAREKEIMKNRYLGIVTHDLRNPLHAVMSFTEILQQEGENLSDDHKEYLQYISQSAEQMKSLTSEMMDIQKIEEGVVQNQLEMLRVQKILDGLIAGHQRHSDQKNIRLILNSNIQDTFYQINKSVFLQVADNLLSNAIKFSPPDSSITLNIEDKNNKLILTVIDEGPGITSSEMPFLFQRFQKLSNQPTAGESSTGLGLSIVKDRINGIGGTIICNSSPGEGSEFIAEFPIEP